MTLHWGEHGGAFCFWLGHECVASLRSVQEADALAVSLMLGNRHICVDGPEGVTRYPLRDGADGARRCARDALDWADAQRRA